MSESVDVVIIGAGAAGLMCAAVAGQRGQRVVLLDHASRLAEKIRISGGGRCNFTNIGTTWQQFLSANPAFCRSALSAYTPEDFLTLVRSHGIAWHEKHKGQLFCDDSSEQIIDMLVAECEKGGVKRRMQATVSAIGQENGRFTVQTQNGMLTADKLVIATGGMAIPQLGATDFGLKAARQFGLKIIEPRPALVPLTFDQQSWKPFAELSGLAVPARLETGQGKRRGHFDEDLLFTHRGLSGPGILQISSYWEPDTPIHIDLLPGRQLAQELVQRKKGSRQSLVHALSEVWPRRLAENWLQYRGMLPAQRLADTADKPLMQLADSAQPWTLTPSGTVGYKKAEVMRGGVDTRALDQKSMQARNVPGLYFIGEVVDVTGWLGGYNFQWAWASAMACGRALST
ncbi:MAG: NAD(P)/FAD-dependent oxidoreductase [Advenella sp.]|uniref:Aminoacetone oxidase family FAD-binding enzyme n=1 Tax=Advenella kashmirensis TaxID=310575 RepID=A0A356LJQ6_9BURK|nr:NAD(P)/FAD-dependent oxidoreductase [Advenella sp. FME57]HBP30968.1 aminoacetone oxidase family FAD-binding enzyme [Advenella kashmirensis]